MIISYNWLNSFFKDKLPEPQKLAEILTLKVFETEKPFKSGDDYVMEIGVLPDRGGSALSHLGIARECSSILDLKIEEKNKIIKEDKTTKIDDYLSVDVKDKKACTRYTARVLTGIKVGESPQWIKDRLKICGISSINNIVDVTNYIMLETGQPLHAFDYEKISENKHIIVDFAKPKEKILTLGGREFILNEKVLTIRDEKNALAIAGIKGGATAEIDNQTKAIILESAVFDAELISKTSKKIKIRTDSSFRFEHDLDVCGASEALDRGTRLIQKLTQANVLKGMIDICEEKPRKKRIKLDLNYLNNLLGIEIKKTDVKKILKSLGFEIFKEDDNDLLIDIPTYRKDIEIQENLIEEVGRIYGYDKIEAVLPITRNPVINNLDVYWKNLFRRNLKSVGFSEVYNYSFISKEDKDNFNLSRLIEIENPINVNSEYLRNSAIPQLVRNLKLNLKYYKIVNIYEIGKIFIKNGEVKEKNIFSGVSSNSFPYLKGAINNILNEVGIVDIEYINLKGESNFWHSKKSATIKINQKEIGIIGCLSSAILDKIDLKIDPIFFEINFDMLRDECSTKSEYRPISTHPKAVRDISIIVPENVLVGDILEIIYDANSELINDVELFDLYENNKENKKSISFHVIFQASDRVLENKEIQKIQENIISELEKNPQWEVKK